MSLREQAFDFVQLSWGEKYRHYLCQYSLPMLLAPGNLPAWPYRNNTQLVLYCPSQDWELIRNSPIVSSIQQWIEVVWEPIATPAPQENKYFHYGRIFGQAIERARARKAGMVLLGADIVLCDQSLASLAQMIAQGKQIVLMSSPIVNLEDLQDAFQKHPNPSYWSRDIGSEFIHKFSHKSLRWANFNAEKFTAYPSSVYYQRDNYLMVRQFHLHPFFILNPKPMDFSCFRNNPTIDGDYLCQYQDVYDQIQIVAQREIVGFSFQEAEEERYPGLEMNTIERSNYIYIQAAKLWQPLHYRLFSREIEVCYLGNSEEPTDNITVILDLLYLALICNHAYNHHAFDILLESLPQALDLTPHLEPFLDQVSPDLLMCFLCLCNGLFLKNRRSEFLHAGKTFALFFQRIAKHQISSGSFDRQLLNLVLNLETPDQASMRAEYPDIHLEIPFSLVFIRPDGLEQQVKHLAAYPFQTQQVILCVPVSALELFNDEEGELAALDVEFSILILEEMAVQNLCALIDLSQSVFASPSPRLFLLCVRAAMLGKLQAEELD